MLNSRLFRHYKNGRMYKVITDNAVDATNGTDQARLVVYQDVLSMNTYVRAHAEFFQSIPVQVSQNNYEERLRFQPIGEQDGKEES